MKDDQTPQAGLSRRAFFKGSAAAAAGVAAGSVLPAAQAAVPASPCARPSWEQRAKPIPASEIKNKLSADVVVVGAGLAGICAALSAAEAGAKVVVLEKNKGFGARGLHIGAFGTKKMQELGIKVDYRQVLRDLFRWGQGRVNEKLVWLYARKSGACYDWAADHAATHGLTSGVWDGYFKGADYTEYPVTHMFYNPKTDEHGAVLLVKALEQIAKEKGVQFLYRTPALQLEREGDGPVTGVVAGKPGEYTLYQAKGGVVMAMGDYASNKEMVKYYSPISSKADAQIYFPNKCNTGEGHVMAMAVGGAMQAVEPHASVIHLEAGAASYAFLHVNALGERFKNEDVNTQSKSCGKLYEPDGIAWTVYDSNWLNDLEKQIDGGQAGGLFFGQFIHKIGQKWDRKAEQGMLDAHIRMGRVVKADTIEELATKMKVPVESLKKTVARYNELAAKGDDEDFGKRKELMRPIVQGPFYAGTLKATLLTMCGGLRTNETLNVLDWNDKPVKNLYVAGSAQGDFFAGDYPTIVCGIGLGRCITFGRLAGLKAAGKSLDTVPSIKI